MGIVELILAIIGGWTIVSVCVGGLLVVAHSLRDRPDVNRSARVRESVVALRASLVRSPKATAAQPHGLAGRGRHGGPFSG